MLDMTPVKLSDSGRGGMERKRNARDIVRLGVVALLSPDPSWVLVIRYRTPVCNI